MFVCVGAGSAGIGVIVFGNRRFNAQSVKASNNHVSRSRLEVATINLMASSDGTQ